MSRIRFLKLSGEEERTRREACQRGPKYEFRMRCLCIIMNYQHHTLEQLTSYFEVSRHTIYNWLNAWQRLGLAGLYRHPGQGRKAALQPGA